MAHYVKSKRRCSHCGSDPEECSDPKRAWYPQRTVCYATMASRAANEKYDEIHKDAPFHDGQFLRFEDKRSTTAPFHVREGVTIWAAPMDLSPDDKFLSGSSARGLDPEGDGSSDQHYESR